MKRPLQYSISAAVLGLACCFASGKDVDPLPNLKCVHPEVFEMVACWNPDTIQPVATEISLDAVEKNRNQFDLSAIRHIEGWVQCPGESGIGFRRFKTVSQKGTQFVVEYQENTGGTLTTTATIECSIVERPIRIAGQQKRISVLRIDSVTSRS